MQEIPFTIPVSGVLRINGGEITITVNRTETSFSFKVEPARRQTALEGGVTLNDIVLETARDLVAEKGFNRLHASEIFHKALERHPDIKRNSVVNRVVACTPDHPSNKHFASRRDFFSYGGNGLFMLNERYMPLKRADGTFSQPVNVLRITRNHNEITEE